MNRPPRSLLLVPFAAFLLAALVWANAIAQKPEECKIEGPDRAECEAKLCGPASKEDPSYEWTGPDGFTASTQCVIVHRSGTYTLVFSDRKEKSTCTHEIKISCKNRPPECDGARARDGQLWPPDHKFEAVEIVGVTDPDGDPVTITAIAVTQDEPLNTEGDGSTCADAQIVGGQASVRRERTGDPNIPGNGRVYVVTFVAEDGRGGKCKGSVSICVPHDQGQGDACVDDGQNYDSLGPCP